MGVTPPNPAESADHGSSVPISPSKPNFGVGKGSSGLKVMLSVGSLIYTGAAPLVKMYLTILLGYFFARTGLFPQEAAKGTSSLTLNLALPALVFSSIVPAFTPANISAIGPLVLLAIVYILIGLLCGLVIREVCYVPRNFWQGIVVASGLGNWSSLPTAIVLSITQSSPFDPKTDTDLGISFVSIFILIYHIFFWVCGLAHSLSWDYAPGVPQGEAANVRVSWREKPICGFVLRNMLKITNRKNDSQDLESPGSQTRSAAQIELASRHSSGVRDEEAFTEVVRRTPHSLAHSCQDSRARSHSDHGSRTIPPSPTLTPPGVPSWSRRVLTAIAVLVTPISSIVAISLLIALVDPLKALFVSFEGGPSWKAPDGKPPLAFVIDTARLIGAMTVPMTLLLLGVSFARMDVKLSLKSGLPIFALLSVCVAKMVFLPIVGVFVTRAMIASGMINPESRVQIFVAIFVSGTPSAINQLMVASSYSPDGKQDVLSALLFLQYIFMPFSSLALIAIALLSI